jgi:radical SAM superfamily enzyme YgiQ (UPF0313 family)
MKILFVYPECPKDTFWSFRYSIEIAGKKAVFPPLGLLTIAAMLPSAWEKKLVDMNISRLRDGDIRWADYVFISAMAVQKKSAEEVIGCTKALGIKVVAGGPLFTSEPERFLGVDHLILNEAEVTLRPFLEDLAKGKAQRIYTSSERPFITKTPIPLWSLIDIKKYLSMNIQYSRGCPFDCEFCDIVFLNGHIPRTKNKNQIIAELDALYRIGWRGSVMFVDDNFIGNKKKLKEEILPAIIIWSLEKDRPFTFYTEASINLADDEDLMNLMTEAGFNRVFVGIETPDETSLRECNKQQNTHRDLVACVKIIQNHGFEVMGGFIVGFDSDKETIFQRQINFIQKTGIVSAMMGLLNAPRGTNLYKRLEKEKRLIEDFSGNNNDSLNFVPVMEKEKLVSGYKKILSTIYSPEYYYGRIKTFLKEYKPKTKAGLPQLHFHHFSGFFKTTWLVGITGKGKYYYWSGFFSTLFSKPGRLPLFVTLAAYGHHFRRVSEKVVQKSI